MSKLKYFQLQSNHDFNKLLTLEAVIEQLSDYVAESGNGSRAFSLVILYKDALSEPLTLSQFIPVDSEEKPIEAPKDFEPCACAVESIAYDRDYKTALDACIFEGWELEPTGSDTFLIKNAHWAIDWYGNYGSIRVCKVNKGFAAGNLEYLPLSATFADLATATIDNPINLKSC